MNEHLMPFRENWRNGCVQAGIEYADDGIAFSGGEQESKREEYDG